MKKQYRFGHVKIELNLRARIPGTMTDCTRLDIHHLLQKSKKVLGKIILI